MTGKPVPFTETLSDPISDPIPNSNNSKTILTIIVNLNDQADWVHHTQIWRNFQNNKPNSNKNYISNSRTQSPNYRRSDNCSRRLFSKKCLRYVRNQINSLLDQEQTDDTLSQPETTETQNVSEEKLLEQKFNHLLIEFYYDKQDD